MAYRFNCFCACVCSERDSHFDVPLYTESLSIALHGTVASLGLVSPGTVIAVPPPHFFDLLELKNLAIFSLLTQKISFIPKRFHDLFQPFAHRTCNLSLIFLNHFTHKTQLFVPFNPRNLLFFSFWCHPLRWCHQGLPAPSAPASLATGLGDSHAWPTHAYDIHACNNIYVRAVCQISTVRFNNLKPQSSYTCARFNLLRLQQPIGPICPIYVCTLYTHAL